MSNLTLLADVADVFNGKTPSAAEKRTQGHPVLKIKDVDDVGSFKGAFESFVDSSLADAFRHKWIEQGDTLILNAAHNSDYVGSKTYLASEEVSGAMPTGEWLVVRGLPGKASKRFIHHWLTSDRTRKLIRDRVKGIHLYPKDVAGLKISFPPLRQQEHIATLLDKADAIRRKRRETLKLADEFLRSAFLDLFGDPVTNSKEWPRKPLYALCEAINDCPHSTPQWSEDGEICLRTSNLTEGGWDWSDKRFVSTEVFHQRSSRGYLAPGDIVLSREGTVGIAAIVPAGTQMCMGQRLVQLRPGKDTRSQYLLMHLLYVLSPARISMLMVGSTSQHLNVRELRNLSVPHPPAPIQSRFCELANRIERTRAMQFIGLEESETLFQALQQRAFNGELAIA